jgi:hypothetical protein
MEWHFAIVALAVLGLFFPAAYALVALGLAYTLFFCISCARAAQITNLMAVDGPPVWWRRLRWRAMLTLLNFLEPIARDWGRLKGGLTPWRRASPGMQPGAFASRWWQRLAPWGRHLRWTYRGGVAIEQHAMLTRLTQRLMGRGCAVGWNPVDVSDWDVKARRGALSEARVRMVVEHHGGPDRLARVSVVLRPPRWVFWLQGAVTVAAGSLLALGETSAVVLTAAGLACLWIGLVADSNRLEKTVRGAADEVIDELESAR